MSDFRTLPISLSFQHLPPVQHYLYFKEHFTKDQSNVDTPPDRTLFLVNLPLFCTQEFLQYGRVLKLRCLHCHSNPSPTLRKVFELCGDVEKVTFGVHSPEKRAFVIDPLDPFIHKVSFSVAFFSATLSRSWLVFFSSPSLNFL